MDIALVGWLVEAIVLCLLKDWCRDQGWVVETVQPHTEEFTVQTFDGDGTPQGDPAQHAPPPAQYALELRVNAPYLARNACWAVQKLPSPSRRSGISW